jgi:hypothetical protein
MMFYFGYRDGGWVMQAISQRRSLGRIDGGFRIRSLQGPTHGCGVIRLASLVVLGAVLILGTDSFFSRFDSEATAELFPICADVCAVFHGQGDPARYT